MQAKKYLTGMTRYKLIYHDLGKKIQFSCFKIQFFSPTQKIETPKLDKFFYKPRNKNKALSFWL